MTEKLDLLDVRKIVEEVIDRAVSKRASSSFELTKDFYWHVPSPEVYVVDQDPPELDIGSLRDDWDLIRKIATSEQEALANNLIGVSFLLRHIGESLAEELAKDGG